MSHQTYLELDPRRDSHDVLDEFPLDEHFAREALFGSRGANGFPDVVVAGLAADARRHPLVSGLGAKEAGRTILLREGEASVARSGLLRKRIGTRN